MRFIAWGVEGDIEKNKGGLREGGRKMKYSERKIKVHKEEGLMRRMREGRRWGDKCSEENRLIEEGLMRRANAQRERGQGWKDAWRRTSCNGKEMFANHPINLQFIGLVLQHCT